MMRAVCKQLQLLNVVCLALIVGVSDVAGPVQSASAGVRRHEPGTISAEDRAQILESHNRVRRKEGASDMELMTWDEALAEKATEWAAKCIFEHGGSPLNPAETEKDYGQNLYVIASRTFDFANAIEVEWSSNEKVFYHYDEVDQFKCAAPTGKTCGHYTQVVWATSRLVGCAYYICIGGMVEFNHPVAVNLVCNYLEYRGNYDRIQPFEKGRPCSRCASGSFWCNDGLCTSRPCSPVGKSCWCAAECHNCATLDVKTCRCNCADGWTGSICTKRCVDEPKCGYQRNPGGFYPKKNCNNPTYRNFMLEKCPILCEVCKGNPKATAGQCPVVYGFGAGHKMDFPDFFSPGFFTNSTATQVPSAASTNDKMKQLITMMLMMVMILNIVCSDAAL